MTTGLPRRADVPPGSSTGRLAGVPTRRTVLLGGAGIAAAGLVGAGVGIEQGVLPGPALRLQAHLGLNGEDGVIPDVEPGPVLEDSFTSAARGGVEVGWSLLLPPGTDEATPLPVVVALHGLGADHATLTGPEFGLDRYLAQHVEDGGRPFAIAAPDGGRGYWHPHDGDDAGAMVTRRAAADPRGARLRHQPASGSWAGRWAGTARSGSAGLRGRATTAVVASSPALWSDPDEASRRRLRRRGRVPRVHASSHDQDDLARHPGPGRRRDRRPVLPSTSRTTSSGLPRRTALVHTFEPGGHTPGYWRRMLPAQLEFLGTYV